MSTNPLPKIPVKKCVDEFLSDKEYKQATTLCAIMNSYGSDKGEGRHNYTTLYSKLFDPWKNEEINLFELGIGTNFADIPFNMGIEGKPGASLLGWALFFPRGHIFGADIDKRVLFNDSHIQTYYCDQRDAVSIQNLFLHNDLKNRGFDIMIDDGLHEFDANLNFLLNSIYKLKKNGIYIIEDLDASSRLSFIQMLPKLKKKLNVQYIEVIMIPFSLNRFDNALLIIQK